MFKHKLFSAVILAGIVLAALLVSQTISEARAVAARFPLGQWMFESTTDSNGLFYSTNGACIQAGGTWYATSSGKGSGHWYLKGTSIHLHGNYPAAMAGVGVNDSFELTVANQTLLTGYLQEWNDGGSYNGYYRSKWTFVSATCAAPSQ